MIGWVNLMKGIGEDIIMNTDRIREIQMETAYPESHSVAQALLKVWNECSQVYELEIEKYKKGDVSTISPQND